MHSNTVISSQNLLNRRAIAMLQRRASVACPSTRLSRPVVCQAQSSTAAAPGQQAATVLPTVALKEWNVAIAALHRGEQTVLLRKGGIKEPVFKPPASQFLLFPTSFHSDTQLLKDGVAERYAEELLLEPKKMQQLALGTYVEVTGAWVTEDPYVLQALDGLHIWTQAFVEARLKWRSKQPLTLLELRAWRVQPPLSLQVHEDFFGCFSFVDLSTGLQREQLGQAHVQPVMDDQVFAAKQQELRKHLAAIDAQPLEL